MLTDLSKNVIFIKDIQSNLIDEAFFILKHDDNNSNSKYAKKRREIIMTEINEIIKEYSMKFQSERERTRKQEANKKAKQKKIKKNIFLFAVIFVATCFIISKIAFS